MIVGPSEVLIDRCQRSRIPLLGFILLYHTTIGSQRLDQELCNRDFRPQYGLGQIPSRGSGGIHPPESEAKCEIRVQFLTFSCANFLDFMNKGAELGQYFRANTQ